MDFNRVRNSGGVVLVLLCLDEGGEDIEAVPIGRIGFGFVLEIPGDLGECPVVVVFGPDRSDIHDTFGSILSYSSCVPTNSIRTRQNL